MDTAVVEGRAYREILRQATARQSDLSDLSDLIVMGVHGRGTLDLMVFGSTTHHVMSRQASAEREKRANITKAEGDKEAAVNPLPWPRGRWRRAPGAMHLRTLQTIDGLGPSASNTVLLAVPVELMEIVGSLKDVLRAKA